MSLRQARMERRDKRKSLIKMALLLGAALLTLGIIYQVGVNTRETVTRLSRDINRVEYGSLEDKLSGQAIVINQEAVVIAESGGRFENLVEEKEKVSKGALLGYFISDQAKITHRAQISGIFINNPDGLEETFRTMSLGDVSSEVFSYKPKPANGDHVVQAGQAIYKIVDSLQPTRLLLRFPAGEIDFELKNRQPVTIILGGKDLGKAVIVDMKQDAEELFMVLECNSFREELTGQRYVDMEVVFHSYNGYLVPKKAVVDQQGKKGIYCSNGEDITFKPIKIIQSKNDIVVVEGLNENDLVVNNPPH